jgi:hypothetical protein
MHASARAFFEHLIDYAGMFPPAKLPMAEALQNYTRIAAGPDAWMLGRFVCRTPHLGELASLVQSSGATAPLPVIALGQGVTAGPEYKTDFEHIEAFRENRALVVDIFETPVPRDVTPGDLSDVSHRVSVAERGVVRLPTFLEIPMSSVWERDIYRISLLLAGHAGPSARQSIGLKIRCGGTAVPSVQQVAFFIDQCREARLSWKATAGLHHPLHAGGVMAHGFINVFGAGILAHIHNLGRDRIAEVLTEESADAFRFTDDGFGWRDWTCTVDQIREARRWMPSFGSCSFDEPRDDLRALGWID